MLPVGVVVSFRVVVLSRVASSRAVFSSCVVVLHGLVVRSRGGGALVLVVHGLIFPRVPGAFSQDILFSACGVVPSSQ